VEIMQVEIIRQVEIVLMHSGSAATAHFAAQNAAADAAAAADMFQDARVLRRRLPKPLYYAADSTQLY